jgi:ADP-ribose pyrophosphatase
MVLSNADGVKMSSSDLTEKQLSSQTVYRGGLLHVKEDQVQLPNGQSARREYILHPGAVVIIPLLANGQVVMERQFRYPLNRDLYELPAGKLDAGETALLCGQRELLEETGYSAANWRYVATIHPCIGYSGHRILQRGYISAMATSFSRCSQCL